MIIKKIFNSTVFDISIFDSERMFLVSRGRGLIYNTNTGNIEYKSPHLSNLSVINLSQDKKQALISNTLGKCLLVDTETEEVLYKFFLKYEPWPTSIIAINNEFLYIDKKGNVCKIDKENRVETIFLNSFNINMCYIVRNNENSYLIMGCNFSESIIEIYFCNMLNNKLVVSNHIEIEGQLTPRGYEQIGDNIFLAIHRPCGNGFKYVIIKIDMSERLVTDFIYPFDYRLNKNSCFEAFAISPNNEHIIIAYHDLTKIISLRTNTVVSEFELDFVSDVKWIDNNRCLIGTWKGLFEISQIIDA